VASKVYEACEFTPPQLPKEAITLVRFRQPERGNHMIFAEADGSFGFVLMMAFLLYGATRAVKMISGNATAKSAITKGAFHVIGRLFK
jgi:hypothetical protein